MNDTPPTEASGSSSATHRRPVAGRDEALCPAAREMVEAHVQECADCSGVATAPPARPPLDRGPTPDSGVLKKRKGLGRPSDPATPRPGDDLGAATEGEATVGAAPPPAPSPRGLAIAGFHIVREIGRGGMGVVYEAAELALGRQVALKVLSTRSAGNRTTAERFRREARAAARLHHTNIVPVFGFGEDDGHLYYAMQLIGGEGLDRIYHRLCDERGGGHAATIGAPIHPALPDAAAPAPPEGGTASAGSATIVATIAGPASTGDAPTVAVTPSAPPVARPLTSSAERLPRSSESAGRGHFRTTARIGWQVAEALAYAHKQGILHRDIKPSNILIDGQGAAWVADFGLAKAADGEDALTQTGDIVGTLRYMAPERFDGRSDARGDVYALGITLYELLTLRPVFQESNRALLIQKALRENPPRPRAVDRGIPRDLETIVLKAIAKEPSARYPAAAAMAEDLRRHLAGEPILARRFSTAELAWRWSRRNPMVASLLAVLATVLVAGFAAMAVLWTKAEVEASAARESADKAGRLAASEARTRAASVLQSARLEMDTGTLWARQQRVGRGLLWMDRGLRSSPPDAGGLRRAARADMAAWSAAAVAPVAALEHPRRSHEFALSPGGRTLGVGADNHYHLWDLGTGKKTRVFDARGGGILGRFSPDGRWVVTTSEYTGARLWEVATGALLRQITPAVNFISTPGFTPDGRRCLCYNHYEGVAWIYSLPGGEQVGKTMIHGGGGANFALSPGGTRIVSAGNDGKTRIWDAATGEPIGQPLGHGGPIFPWFSPAGDRFLIGNTGPGPGVVRVYETATTSLLAEIPVRSSVLGLAFRPDGRSVLICEQAGTARLHDLSSGREVGATIRADAPVGNHWSFGVAPAVFSPDGQTIATAHIDNTVRLWDAETGRPIGPILEHDGPIHSLAFRPDGRTLLTSAEDGVVRVWDVAPAFPGRILPWAASGEAAELSPDGRTLCLVDDGVVRLVDRESGMPVAPPLVHDIAFPPDGTPPLLDLPRVRVARFSPDGRLLATGGYDGGVRLWEVATGRPAAPPMFSEHWVLSLAFSPDGKSLAAGCVTNRARVWDVATGKPLTPSLHAEHPFGQNEINWVAFRGDGRVLVTGGSHDSARFWDARDGRPIDRKADLSALMLGHLFASPDGKTLLVRKDAETRVWDLEGPRPVGTGFSGDGGPIAFRADGLRLVSVGASSAKVWGVASRSRVGASMEHPSAVTVAGFTPDGALVVTGCRDGRIRAWDAETGRPIGPALEHGPAVERLLFPPDGLSVIAVGGNRVTTWDLARPSAEDSEKPSTLARRLSMHRLSEQGDMLPLPAEEWRGLAREGAPSAQSSSADMHDRLASLYVAEGRPEAAVWHLDRLIAVRPGRWSDLARRSLAHRALSRRGEADADAARAEALAPPDRLKAWRADLDLTEARDAVRAGRLADSLPPLDRLSAASAPQEALARRRVELLAALRRWEEADAESRALMRRWPGSLHTFTQAALLRLHVGDRAEYARLCEDMLGRCGQTPIPPVAALVAWACVVGPGQQKVSGPTLDLARRFSGHAPNSSEASTILGAALHRAGRDDQAIQTINRGMKLRAGRDDQVIQTINRGMKLRTDGGTPQDWAFLALAHARQGRMAEARRNLAKLDAWPLSNDPAKAFEDLKILVLRREARSVVLPDAGFPSDPFAH